MTTINPCRKVLRLVGSSKPWGFLGYITNFAFPRFSKGKYVNFFFHGFVVFSHGFCVFKTCMWKWMKIFILLIHVLICLKCTTYLCKNYEPMKKEFHTISITKSFTSWDAKFVKWAQGRSCNKFGPKYDNQGRLQLVVHPTNIVLITHPTLNIYIYIKWFEDCKNKVC